MSTEPLHPRPWVTSLRLRLVLLLSAAVIPALLLMLYTASGERAAAAAEAQADALRVARSAASDQAALVDQTRLVLLDLNQAYVSSTADFSTCTALYSELRARYVQNYPRYENLGVIDPEGQVFCSVVAVRGPVNVSARADYRAAVASPDLTVGEALYDDALGKTFVNLYYPVLNFRGGVRAVLFATVDLDWLQQLTAEASLPEGSSLTVFDRTGRLLAQYPEPPPGGEAGQVPEALLEAVLAGTGAGTTDIRLAGGQDHLYAFTPLTGSGGPGGGQLYVSVGIPAAIVYARADQVLARNLLALGLVAVFAAAVSWFGSDLVMVRPLRDLLNTTRRLAAGDLRARPGLRVSRATGEVGQLARAFDQMADALEQRDAALRRSEELYRTLAHNFPNGAVLLYDHDLRYVLADGAGLPAVGLSREMLEGKTIWELFSPETAEVLEPHYRQALAGTPSSVEVDFSGRIFFVQALPLRNEHGDIFLGMVVSQDVTERRQAFALLEQRVAERTRELSAMLRVSRDMSVSLVPEVVLNLVLDRLKDVVDYTAASVLILEGDEFVMRAYRGPVDRALIMRVRFSADQPLARRVVDSRQPYIIADIRGDSADAVLLRDTVGDLLDVHYPGIHTWLRVPLMAHDRALGILTLHHAEPNFYTAGQADLVMAFANQAAVAVENARLFAAERRRAEQFRLINEVSQHITSILAVDELLSQTVRLIQAAFGYYHVHVGIVEDDHIVFQPSAGVWRENSVCLRCANLRLKVGLDGVSGWVAQTGELHLVPDISKDDRYVKLEPDQRGSALFLPLKIKGQVIGVFSVESETLNDFDDSDIAVLNSLVNQLAIAMENAQLYEQARQLAALEERQKLARELHDSVSQALYGIALGARTARMQLERDAARAGEPLDYVLSLAEAGLAEMRALIFELRPESIKNEGLVAALTKQADSLRARHRVDVATSLGPEPELPLETKEALYRISQEALHNIAKHARASRVELRLLPANGSVTLEVFDNGVGFDPKGEFPGHLGLKSMRERAERVGGRLDLDSAPGQGTRIRVEVPAA